MCERQVYEKSCRTPFVHFPSNIERSAYFLDFGVSNDPPLPGGDRGRERTSNVQRSFFPLRVFCMFRGLNCRFRFGWQRGSLAEMVPAMAHSETAVEFI